MCISPVTIPNPNYRSPVELVKKTTDTHSKYLQVPCGVCPECKQARQMNLIQRSRIMALDHYIFFATLTYNPESLPIYTLDDGRTIPYADISDVQKMFKRIRKDDLFLRPFKYLFVSERGKKGRPHFHGMIFIPKSKEDETLYPAIMETHISNVLITEWRRNYGSRRKPI